MAASSSASYWRHNAWPVLAIATVLVSFFLLLGRAPLFDVDEGAFSQATLEMFQRDDFLSTYLNGEPRYDKPILVYWLQAASVLLFGANEFAFRFPSAVCATAWALITFLFVQRFYGTERACLAAAMLASSLGVYVIGRAATADALLNLLIAAAMFCGWMYLHTQGKRWLYGTFAAIGLGFLAKGPVALLIPLAVTFLFCILRRDFKTWLRAVLDWKGLVLFVAIAAPWYAAIFAKEGWAFFEGFFLKHNVARFGGPLQGHAGSLVYYIPVVLVASLPYTALLLPVFARVRQIWRDDLQCYLLLWFAFVFAFFSLSGTKLPHYVLYGMTGLFILMALQGENFKSRFWALLPALTFFLALLLLPRAVQLFLPHVSDDYYREALANADAYFTHGYFVIAAIGTAVTLYLMVERTLTVARKLVVAALVAVIAMSAFVVPVGGGVQQEPIKEAALLCREQGIEPIMWRLNAPSFSVYRGKPTASREPVPGDVVITKAKRLTELIGVRFETLYSKNGIVVVRITR